MPTSRIELTGTSPTLNGLSWESRDGFKIGRQVSNDIVLQDHSVDKDQAEIRTNGRHWLLRDLANSERSPSFLNGVQLKGKEAPLNFNDTLQFGRLKLKVSRIDAEEEQPPEPAQKPNSLTTNGARPSGLLSIPAQIKTTGPLVKVEAATHRTWEEALEAIALDPKNQMRQGQNLLTLLRTGYHLCHISSLDELLNSILSDTIRALSAQRGAIVLADAENNLHLRAVQHPQVQKNKGLGYSRTLAHRSFSLGESLLCQDVAMEAALQSATSVRHGAMASIICALLRSPRSRLGILHLDRGPFQEPFTIQDFYLADAIAASVSMGIESALLVEQQRDEFIQSVTSLARTVEMRDQYTGDHTKRVTDYSVLLGRELGLSPAEIYQIQIGTPLHDIGKIGVHDSILRKPGRLTNEEFEEMKQHTTKGAVILQSIKNLDPMIPIVRHHHERWDGRGYPDGLVSVNIPLTARVVAVTDAFDAMTSDRPYRQAMTASEAFAELHKSAGTHFDPECVAAFLKIQDRVEQVLRRKPQDI